MLAKQYFRRRRRRHGHRNQSRAVSTKVNEVWSSFMKRTLTSTPGVSCTTGTWGEMKGVVGAGAVGVVGGVSVGSEAIVHAVTLLVLCSELGTWEA